MGQPISTPAIFVRVVERGSIRGAARALAIPKSNVSRRLAELEAHLGVRLLQRTTRRLSLTDAGTTYYRGASAAIATLDDAERDVRALQSEPRGLLRVTAPNNFGREFLTPIALRFMRTHPAVEVSLALTDRMVDLVEEGFDLAVRAGPLPDSTLVAHKLGATTFVTVASERYLVANGRPRKPEDLARHECLLHGDSHRATWRFRRGRASLDVRVRGRFACTSFHYTMPRWTTSGSREFQRSSPSRAWRAASWCASSSASSRPIRRSTSCIQAIGISLPRSERSWTWSQTPIAHPRGTRKNRNKII